MDGFVFPTFPSDLVAYRVSEAVSPCAFGPIIVSELYVVKVTGGTPTLVSQSIDKSMLSARTIVDITFSPDGSRIMYQDGFLDCKQFSGVNLVSAAVDGSEQVTLSFPMTNGRSGIGKYKISPDGSLVLFSQSIADDNRQMGLFVVPANGGTPLLLSQPIGDSSGITDFELVQSSEGLRAVYLQNEFFGPGPGNYQVRSHLFSVLVPPIPEPNSIAAFLIFLLLAPPLTRRQ